MTSPMEELIIKYLTDRLSDSEMEQFTTAMKTDSEFRKNFKLYLATLALTDLSLDYPQATCKEFEAGEAENKTEHTISKD